MRKVLMVLLGGGLMALPSMAGIVTYNDLATFEAALGGNFQVETFTGNTINTPGLTFISTAGSIGSDRFNDRVVHGGASTTWNLPGPSIGFGGNWDLTPGGAGQGIEFFIDGVTLVPGEVPNSFS